MTKSFFKKIYSTEENEYYKKVNILGFKLKFRKGYKCIKFYAFRDNKGATGGPGGVLYLQKNILGDKFKNIKLKYKFRKKTSLFKKIFENNIYGGFIQVLLEETFSFNNYYICNEISTAFGMALLNKKYSIIFHQQGPQLEEFKNFGITQKGLEKYIIKTIEKIAFTKAQSVHFPSLGAQEIYFNSDYASCQLKEVHVGKPLSNTIEIKPYHIIEKDTSKLTFLSVGSITPAKGQDRALEFLKNFLELYKKPVRYICVGVGPLQKDIVTSAQKIEQLYSNFEFIHLSNLPHLEIIRLNMISDIYIMCHRISIFDLATLEAMSQRCAIVLSNVGGNKDFNIKDNIIFTDCNNYQQAAEQLLNSDIEALKQLNKEIFDNYFSANNFKEQYETLLESITHKKSQSRAIVERE